MCSKLTVECKDRHKLINTNKFSKKTKKFVLRRKEFGDLRFGNLLEGELQRQGTLCHLFVNALIADH